jgi:hypothetical protein
MSLIGRLEDLPITDILQIVFLSRRTGILEIMRGENRSQVLFVRGLIVAARSAAVRDIAEAFVLEGRFEEAQAEMARTAARREPVTPLGQTLLELGFVSPTDLGAAAVSMVRKVIEPLIGCEDGEFNFILREALDPVEIEFDPEELFRGKGLSPQQILAKDGEKLIPLKALQDQMRTGKLMMSQRGLAAEEASRTASPGEEVSPPPVVSPASPPPSSPVPPVEPELPPPPPPPAPGPPPPPAAPLPRMSLEFAEIPASEDDLASIGPLQLEDSPSEAPPAFPAVSVIVAGGEEERRKAFEERTVVILEAEPLVRVAAKRLLAKKGIRTFHFNDPEEVHRTVRELFDAGKFFVTILGVDPRPDGQVPQNVGELLGFVRKLGRGYPTVATIPRDDHPLRRELYRAGADVVLTKPATAGLGAAQLEIEVSGFGEELAILAERYHDAWEVAQSEDHAAAKDVGGALAEMARKDRGRRSLAALKHLISELTGTRDVSEIALMILRVAAEYVDRGVLFLAGQKEFIGLGGFGVTGDGVPMNLRVRRIRVPLSEPSIFSEVRKNRSTHHGKLKKTEWNQRLVMQLGTVYPTEVVAIPVVNRERILAIVYGDNARDKVPIGSVDGLEIFLAQAGNAFEAALVAGRKRRTIDVPVPAARVEEGAGGGP